MMIHDITARAGRNKSRKRVGRGLGSGRGRTSGRGHKGQGSRSGASRRFAFEGGQMPYFRRMPKFGFSNENFRERFWIVNLRDIASHPDFAQGGEVTPESLIGAGLIRDASRSVKILGDLGSSGSLGVALHVRVHRVSRPARRLIEEGGGSVEESGTRRDRVRGIDRNSGDPVPRNLTKKRRRPPAKKGA